MGIIRIDYQEAIREANRLKTIASECNSNIQYVKRLINIIPNYWQGDAAKAFIDELQEWIRETTRIKNDTTNLSTNIRNVAYQIREAERRAIAAMNKD